MGPAEGSPHRPPADRLTVLHSPKGPHTYFGGLQLAGAGTEAKFCEHVVQHVGYVRNKSEVVQLGLFVYIAVFS